MTLTWPQALAWRLQRQQLDPIGTDSVEDVVRRLAAIQSGDAFATELAVRTRRARSEAGEVAKALQDGRLIKTFAFRGATHIMTPEAAGIYLALRASGRMWELPSWQSYYGLAPSDWPALRDVARGALAEGPLTLKELVAALAGPPNFRHLAAILDANPWNVVKVLAWHGDLSFGQLRGRQATLQRLDGNPRWSGVPNLDEAGPRSIEAYLAAYGPATPAHLQYWLGNGLGAGGKRIAGWLAALGDRMVEIDVDGTAALLLREHLEQVTATPRSDALRLLPAYDQWILGPGSSDPHIVPPARRTAVSRGAPIAVFGGAVSGTWSLRDDDVRVEWFTEAGPPPTDRIATEVARLASILDRSLEATVETA